MTTTNRKKFLSITKSTQQQQLHSSGSTTFLNTNQISRITKPSTSHSTNNLLYQKITQIPNNRLTIQPIQIYSQRKENPITNFFLIPSQINCFSGFKEQKSILEPQLKKSIQYYQISNDIKSVILPKGQCKEKNCKVKQRWKKYFNPKQVNLYKLLRNLPLSSKIIQQIERDATRTYVQLSGIHEQYTQNQSNPNVLLLKKALETYAKFDTQVGYVQGINMVVGSLLDHIKQQDLCFSMFVYLMDNCKLRFLYTQNFNNLKDHCQIIIEKHLKQINHQLYLHLKNSNIQAMMFLPSWLLSLFASIVGIQYMHFIIDKFIEDGFNFIYRFSLIYLIYLKSDIYEAGQQCLVVLGSSFSRLKNTNWLQLILASNRIILKQ